MRPVQEGPWSMEAGSGIWLSLSSKAPPSTSFIPAPCARTEGPWSMETGSGIWLSLSSKAPLPTSFMYPVFMQGLGRWGLEVVSGFPYLAKLLPLPASWCSAPCAPDRGLRGLGRRRLEVASGFPYLPKLLPPPASCAPLHAPCSMGSG